jgi:hypothetical protein
MNHAPSAVTPLDPELTEVGDAIGQRAQRRGLVQGAVNGVDMDPPSRGAKHSGQRHTLVVDGGWLGR